MTHTLSKVLFSNQDSSLLTGIPREQILDQSVQITAPNKKFKEWSEQDHRDSYNAMQRIAQTWKSQNITDQYLIYSKVDKEVFQWEMIPYQKCATVIGRIFQQVQVLWRTVFGGVTLSEEASQIALRKYEKMFETSPHVSLPQQVESRGNDAFCSSATNERQWVITGKKVNVLFNYAPIGVGGERLHFLVVPKEHRVSFTDVTEEEYSEALSLTSRLIDRISLSRQNIENIYLLNKTGIDAGQTVNHWHMHVIFSTNKAQDFWGKLTVLKNILFGSSPMKIAELTQRVEALRKELAPISA